jgi:hypothetical protein
MAKRRRRAFWQRLLWLESEQSHPKRSSVHGIGVERFVPPVLARRVTVVA